jgi:hypothetical protein
VYLSKKGTSEEMVLIGDVKIRKDETLLDLKNLIMTTPMLVELNKENKIVNEINKVYFKKYGSFIK